MAYLRLGAEEIDGVSNAVDTDVGLYTASGEVIITAIWVCNRSVNLAKVRIAHVDGAIGVVADEDYLVYDLEVPKNAPLHLKGLGICMVSADTILVRSDIVDVNFIAWGQEI